MQPSTEDAPSADPATEPRRRITLLGRDFNLPRSRRMRILTGILFVVGGLLGFLPILGYWMVPVGLLILSYEYAMVRRWRRRATVRWYARKRERNRRR